MIKSKVFASLLLAFLPGLSMAQSGDDLYFVPKKEQKKEVTKVVPEQTTNTTAYTAPETAAIVVKDVKGNVRDVDEYNRRYTSRENTFSMQNDTLYIEEKPYGERGEWVNGFQGSQSDYEYAMRIVRFRSPGYAIPVSSPLYWDVVYGALPSWDWNVYDDGMYAYVFPTYTNPAWWNWRFSWSTFGPRFGWRFGYPWYYNSWYYSSWYSPYWYGGFYAGYWGGYWGLGYYVPHYGWAPRNLGHTDIRPGRYQASHGGSTRPSAGFGTGSSYTRPSADRIAQDRGNTAIRRSSIGRVVEGSGTRGNNQSVLPGRTAVRSAGTSGNTGTRTGTTSRTQGVYTRPATGADRTGSTYNRPSSTRRSVNYNREGYNNSNTRSSNSTYQRSSNSGSFNRSSGSSYNRSSGSSGVSRGGGSRRR